ncbi:MAG: TM2 domain-containing protein [Clostridia bacterium]
MRKIYNKKKCPKCNLKCGITEKVCPCCGLIFEKLETASNKIAKKKFFSGKHEHIIYNPKCPMDCSYKTTIILCIFLGLFGAHNFYVGKYYKAIFMLVVGVAIILFVAITSTINVGANLFFYLSILTAISSLIWLNDLFLLCIKKFKYPVSRED